MSRRAKSPSAGSSSSPHSQGSSVSRETAGDPPPPPAGARTVFGKYLSEVERYAALLAGAGVERGLLGPREVDRLWDRHLLNCGVLPNLIAPDASVCDIGSGAGLPGIVVAVVRPDLQVTLLEPLLRRATFLSEVVELLELGNAEVVRARAEDHEGTYDAVTARAVAPLRRLARVAVPLCRSGGSVLAMKGQRAASEVQEAEFELPALGVTDWSIERLGEGVLESPTTVVRLSVAGKRAHRPRGTTK